MNGHDYYSNKPLFTKIGADQIRSSGHSLLTLELETVVVYKEILSWVTL